MANLWGNTVLHVTSYQIPALEMNYVEKEIIPDPEADLSTPQTVLMTLGRKRRRRTISGWCNPEDFVSMENDMICSTIRVLQFDDGIVMNAVIEPGKLSAERKQGTSIVFYNCTFVEA